MSIKIIHKFTYNLLKIQYLIIHPHIISTLRNIALFTGIYPIERCTVQRFVGICDVFLKVCNFVYPVQVLNVRLQPFLIMVETY